MAFLQLYLAIVFIMDSFDLYPSLIGIIIVHLSQIPAQSILYGNEITTSLVV